MEGAGRAVGISTARGVKGSRSNRGKQQFNCLWLSVVDREYIRSSTVRQQIVIK